MPDLRILYIERNLAQDSIVFDQIGRMSRLIDPHAVAVQVGSFPHFHHPDVTSVRCPFIPKIEAAKGKSFCRSAVQAVRKLIKSGHDYDLIHANFAYPEGLAACRAAEATGRPYVITGRGDDILLYPDDNAYLKRAVEEAVSRCAGFIGVSQHLCDAACRLGTTPDRCTVIPDGIREDTFHWHTDDEPQRHPHTVLFAGDFLPVKNVLHMAQAFTVVAEARPSVHFRLAGRGPLEEKLKQHLSDLSAKDRCHFLGFLSPAALATEMRTATTLVLPSISEGRPNVIDEAMACGTPVVAAHVGGIPEQIMSDDFGHLCDPKTPDDIADKILKALDRTDWDRERIAHRGREHTRDGSAKRIVDVYEKVLKTTAA